MPYQCGVCGNDKVLKKQNGCVKPSHEVVWEYDGDTFYSCPWKFVPDNVFDWWSEYWYYQETGSWPKFSEIPDRFVEAMIIYKNEYQKAVEELRPKRPGSGSSLSALRNSWGGNHVE